VTPCGARSELSDRGTVLNGTSRIVPFQRPVTNEIIVPLADERCLVFDRILAVTTSNPNNNGPNSPSFQRLTAMQSQDDIIRNISSAV
jgi:hypothetical protein